MEITNIINELYEKEEKLLDLEDTASWLNTIECEIAYLIDRRELDDYYYEDIRYVTIESLIIYLEKKVSK